MCAVYSSVTFLVRHILLPFRVTSPTLRVEYPLRSLAGQSVATKSHALLKMRSKLWYSDGHAALWTSAGQVGLFEILFGVTKYIHIISCRKHYVCKERVDHLYILHNIHTQSSVTYTKNQPFYFCIHIVCLLYTSPSPRDRQKSRMPSSA